MHDLLLLQLSGKVFTALDCPRPGSGSNLGSSKEAHTAALSQPLPFALAVPSASEGRSPLALGTCCASNAPVDRGGPLSGVYFTALNESSDS